MAIVLKELQRSRDTAVEIPVAFTTEDTVGFALPARGPRTQPRRRAATQRACPVERVESPLFDDDQRVPNIDICCARLVNPADARVARRFPSSG